MQTVTAQDTLRRYKLWKYRREHARNFDVSTLNGARRLDLNVIVQDSRRHLRFLAELGRRLNQQQPRLRIAVHH